MSAPTLADVATCAPCGEVFATVELFDRHRTHSRTYRSLCKRPGSLGLVQVRGVWNLAPMSVADRRALWLARQAQNTNPS
jgi:hypothetical protein